MTFPDDPEFWKLLGPIVILLALFSILALTGHMLEVYP